LRYKVVVIVEDELGVYTTVETVPSSYVGPVAQCKKGRQSQAEITQNELDQMKVQEALQKQEQSHADSILNGMELSGKPGQLSPAAQAQYSSDMDNINRTYIGMRQQAFAAMACAWVRNCTGRVPTGCAECRQPR
jgi:hypothetical protein